MKRYLTALRATCLLSLFPWAIVTAEIEESYRPIPLKEVPGAMLIKPNGGWCWYQGPRAIVTRDRKIVFTSISGDSYAGLDAGDLWASSWDPETGEVEHFELHDKFERDDHDIAGLLERTDGKILAVYGKHSSDGLMRWRISSERGSISDWSEERHNDIGATYCYSNVFQLSEENGRIYNFSRSQNRDPNSTFSDDDGESWQAGWRLFHWEKSDIAGQAGNRGVNNGSPYVRYASNNTSKIHFITTEDHPRAFDNSIYHGYYHSGKLYSSQGDELSDVNAEQPKRVTPQSFTRVFEGGRGKIAWTSDLELAKDGNPYAAFSVNVDGEKSRGKLQGEASQDHRYWYARFDGKQWHANEIAYAGTMLYAGESDYTGLIALDPDDPDTVVISTNANPITGKPLISTTDNKRHWELYRGKTADHGKTWKWSAITSNSSTDHLRPNIPSNPDGKRIILWCRGDLKSYTDYRLDICVITEDR